MSMNCSKTKIEIVENPIEIKNDLTTDGVIRPNIGMNHMTIMYTKNRLTTVFIMKSTSNLI